MIDEGDSEWVLAYFALNKYHIMPWEFAELDLRKKAALIAMIKKRVEAEKNAEKEANKNHPKPARRKRRRK